MEEAGLLTRAFRGAFPSRLWRDSGRRCLGICDALTAAGTVQDFHLVPFSFRIPGRDAKTKSAANVEKGFGCGSVSKPEEW